MDITELAALTGAFVAVISSVSGIVIYYLNLKLKPLTERINELEEKSNEMDELASLIVDGLLNNDQIPRTK